MTLSINPGIIWGTLFLMAVVALVLTGMGWKRTGDTKKPVLTQSDKEQIEHLRKENERQKK